MKTVNEIAIQLAVSKAVVYRLIDSGKLKCHRIGLGRGAIRVSEAQLKAFLDSSESLGSPSQSNRSRRQITHLDL